MKLIKRSVFSVLGLLLVGIAVLMLNPGTSGLSAQNQDKRGSELLAPYLAKPDEKVWGILQSKRVLQDLEVANLNISGRTAEVWIGEEVNGQLQGSNQPVFDGESPLTALQRYRSFSLQMHDILERNKPDPDIVIPSTFHHGVYALTIEGKPEEIHRAMRTLPEHIRLGKVGSISESKRRVPQNDDGKEVESLKSQANSANAVAAKQFLPTSGNFEAGQLQPGYRYVMHYFRWDNDASLSGFDSLDAYEHQTVLHNYDSKTYLGRYNNWNASFDSRYYDTPAWNNIGVFGSPGEPDWTIGCYKPKEVFKVNTWYWAWLVTEDGNTNSDTAKLTGQVSTRLCDIGAWCVTGIGGETQWIFNAWTINLPTSLISWPQKVATPSINPGSLSSTGPVTARISTATSGATIRYTTNGSDPTSSSTVYSGSLYFTSSVTLKARAFKSGMTDSDVASATYSISIVQKVATPTINPGSLSSQSPVTASITTSTSGATIRYTTNGTDPNSGSTVYSGPLTFNSSVNLRARAFKSGMTDSDVASVTYSISIPQKVATPVINPGSLSSTGPVTASISTATTGATIRYTTNGSDPTSSSTVYSGSLYFTSSVTLKARAFKSGMTDSDGASATYTILQKVATPYISPGSLSSSWSVTASISTATGGATIRYTTNGTDPTSSSTIYTSPLTFSSSIELRARAFKSGMTDSDVASATYGIAGKVAKPNISPGSLFSSGSVTASISSVTSGATIRYTTNGTDPTSSSTIYTSPLTFSSSVDLRARAFKSGMTDSDIASAVYTMLAIPITGDTDGDNIPDSVSVNLGGIQIIHGGTGKRSFYPYLGLSYSIYAIQDTDGVPGGEVIVPWSSALGVNGIKVIHERTGKVSDYNLNYPNFAIARVVDTDGLPGQEIVVNWSRASGVNGIQVINDRASKTPVYNLNYPNFAIATVADTDDLLGEEVVVNWSRGGGINGIQVIHDRTGKVSSYNLNYPSFAIARVTDTDGLPGEEIVVNWSRGGGENGIQVIHDRTAKVSVYNLNYPNFAIAGVVDTDGLPGEEIVVNWSRASGINGIQIIHDRTAEVSDYPINANFTIACICDKDGIKGAEICYAWTSGYIVRYSYIIDRTRSTNSSSGC